MTVDGTSSSIPAGTTKTTAAWDFVGFSQPVDNLPIRNVVNAGQGIPVRWRVLDQAGRPVTNLTVAEMTATNLSCGLASTPDLIEETTAGAAGLKNLGNGSYELVWKSPKTYGGSCKTLHLDIHDGVTHDAAFEFRK